MLEVAVAEPRERPILFSGPMVPPVLADTKTQTRRAIRVQPWASCCIEDGMDGESPFVYSALGGAGPGYDVEEERSPCLCPYGVTGDRLWVREAWSTHACFDDVAPGKLTTRSFHYWADGDCQTGKKRPSIHMPRWVSRILLEVTDVRVQRLQAISEADALAEGIQARRCPDCHLASYGLPGWGHDQLNPTAQGAYRYLWESINGAGSWDLNPWVWAVSFKRLKP